MSERIDSHVHLWTIARGDYGWLTPDMRSLYRDFTPDDLRPLLAEVGIDRVILVQAAPSVAETEFLLEIANGWDAVAGVVGWVDMDRADAPQTLERLARDPCFKGLRPMIQDIPDRDWMMAPHLTATYRKVADLDLVFDFLVLPPHLDNLLHLLERHADLCAVVCHAAKPDIAAGRFDAWAAHMRRLAAETTAFCKVSGLITEAGAGWSVDGLRPYVALLLEAFGADRLIWGSDWPVLAASASYRAWAAATDDLFADLAAAERAKILGENARRVYRI